VLRRCGLRHEWGGDRSWRVTHLFGRREDTRVGQRASKSKTWAAFNGQRAVFNEQRAAGNDLCSTDNERRAAGAERWEMTA
jgi:hypothetical protein